MIRKSHGKFLLKSETTGRTLGTHATRAEAESQEAAINISKARAAGHRIPLPSSKRESRSKVMQKIRSGKAKFLVPIMLAALVGNAYAATLACPAGWLIGPTAQTATGVSPNVIVPRGSSLTVEGMLTAGTATMQVEICCSPADCSAAGLGWAVVSGSVMTLALATPVVAISVSPPACTYRANVTACSSCSVTAVASCGG